MKIIMVCLGNICRSPMAEGILRHKTGDFAIEIDSAGTSNYHEGEGPDPRAVKTLRKKGIDISHLHARQFEVADFDRFDQIYAMDKSNYQNIIKLARNQADVEKVSLFVNELYPGSDGEVPDPYFGGPDGFEQVFELLDETTDRIVEKLKHGPGK
jgi:protein-tyrosine phosphatase